jgi:predicted ATPase with chaperone activity
MPFLDELPKFSQRVLEALHQPPQNGSVMISRGTSGSPFLDGCASGVHY